MVLAVDSNLFIIQPMILLLKVLPCGKMQKLGGLEASLTEQGRYMGAKSQEATCPASGQNEKKYSNLVFEKELRGGGGG